MAAVTRAGGGSTIWTINAVTRALSRRHRHLRLMTVDRVADKARRECAGRSLNHCHRQIPFRRVTHESLPARCSPLADPVRSLSRGSGSRTLLFY